LAIVELITNKIFIAAIASLILSQLIKLIILSIKIKKLKLSYFFEPSGMPSTNVAVITSLATAIYLSEGFSTVFFVTLAILAFVSQEMLLGRKTIDRHAEIVNSILNELGRRYKPIKRKWSHSPLEVIVGLLLGIVVAYITYLI